METPAHLLDNARDIGYYNKVRKKGKMDGQRPR